MRPASNVYAADNKACSKSLGLFDFEVDLERARFRKSQRSSELGAGWRNCW